MSEVSPTQAEKDAATIAALRAELEALKSQQLTVIAPPLEWGEWREIENDFYKASNKGYTLVRRFGSEIIRVGLITGSSVDGTEEELIDACQVDYQQSFVNAALEGCNITPYQAPSPAPVVLEWVEGKGENASFFAFYNNHIRAEVTANQGGFCNAFTFINNRVDVIKMSIPEAQARAWCVEQITKIITPTPTMKRS